MKKISLAIVLTLLFFSCTYVAYHIYKDFFGSGTNSSNVKTYTYNREKDRYNQKNLNKENNYHNSYSNNNQRENNSENKRYIVNNPTPIQQAVMQGDSEKLKYLIKNDNFNVNQIVYEELGYSLLPFSLAVKHPNAEIVKIIIENGADVNVSTGNNGLTPLHIIVQRKDVGDPVDIVRVLINAGANVNKTDAKGRYIIVHSILHGHVETARLLIQSGADVNVTNSQGYTLLKIAEILKKNTNDERYEQIIQSLKQAGAR